MEPQWWQTDISGTGVASLVAATGGDCMGFGYESDCTGASERKFDGRLMPAAAAWELKAANLEDIAMVLEVWRFGGAG